MDSTTSPIRILLIDADKQDRQHWSNLLTNCSPAFTILEADTGGAGLAICHSQPIDCVLLELVLPDMSGFQVLTRLNPRAYKPDIPVVLFSNWTLPQMRSLAITNGAQTYLLNSSLAADELSCGILKAIAAVGRHKVRRENGFLRHPARPAANGTGQVKPADKQGTSKHVKALDRDTVVDIPTPRAHNQS
jgi:CheY-like chemotaxis protein